MEIWQLALLAACGFLAGWVNVLAGGGSLLTVPVMVFLGLPGPVANGTNRIGIILQNIFAVTAFFRKGFSDFRLSMTLAGVASVGAFFGAQIGVELDGVWFNRVLAAIMIGVMIIMALDRKESAGHKEAAQASGDGAPKNVVLGHILFFGAGVWGGFIQIAAGFIMMPILYRVMGLDLVRVNMHKVFIALVYSIVALAVFASKVDIAWQAGLALAAGTAAGGWVAVHMQVKRGEALIRRVLFAAIAAMAVKLVLFP